MTQQATLDKAAADAQPKPKGFTSWIPLENGGFWITIPYEDCVIVTGTPEGL